VTPLGGIMKFLMAVLLAATLTLGCTNKTITTFYDELGNPIQTIETVGSDYDSHTKARVAFKDSDTERITAQSNGLSQLAAIRPEDSTKTEQYLFAVIIAEKISDLVTQEYNEDAPMTTTELVDSLGGKIVDGTVIVGGISLAVDLFESLVDKVGERVQNGDIHTGDKITVSQENNEGSTGGAVTIDKSKTETHETVVTTTIDRSETEN